MSMKTLSTTRALAQGAIIAALYAALTLANLMYSYGMIQVRLSEALTILPLFTPVAIPGLFVGVVIANLFNPAGAHIIDVIFGSLTTLFAAILTYKIGKKLVTSRLKEIPKFLFAMFPPIILNALIVGTYVHLLWYPAVFSPLVMLSVGMGQIVACYGLGGILYFALKKTKLPL